MNGPSLAMGVLALVLSGLYFLDLSGAVAVDGTVTVVAVWVGLAGVGLVRSALRLRQHQRQRPSG